jgi:hypothetical protein
VIQRGRIFPSFPEREIEFGNGWSTDFKLDVVPRGTGSVPWVQLDDLKVPAVVGVISTTMTEIDSADERNVTIRSGGMTNEDHLLVVRSASAHALIKENFTARLVHLTGEASILLRIEPEAVAVRSPE